MSARRSTLAAMSVDEVELDELDEVELAPGEIDFGRGRRFFKLPCEPSMSGWCFAKRCHGCQSTLNPEYRLLMPTAYLANHRGLVVQDERGPIEVGPWHWWVCTCPCHSLVRDQLTLF